MNGGSITPPEEQGEGEDLPLAVSVEETSIELLISVERPPEAGAFSSTSSQINRSYRGLGPLRGEQNPPIEALNDLTMWLNNDFMTSPYYTALYIASALLRFGAVPPSYLPPITIHDFTWRDYPDNTAVPMLSMMVPILANLSPYEPTLVDQNKSCVYVWNLPPRFTLEELFLLFAPFGRIEECSVDANMARIDNRSHGFIIYDTFASGRAAAINMHGVRISHCRLTVLLYYPIWILLPFPA
uniref:CUGBP Elav family n=1 Tax=Echinococcus granulosus TaxID=6210 RepID=A0A068WE59_ECHGR|nr:CUGBP Elav family [Echinococcus granulosus]